MLVKVMLKRSPLPEAKQPRQKTSSWAIPGPSRPATHPVPVPLTQLISSLGFAKIMWLVEILVMVNTPVFTLTSMLKPLKDTILETLIQKLTGTGVPVIRVREAGATKTVGVPAACAAGGLIASAIIIAARRRIDEARSLEFLLVLCT